LISFRRCCSEQIDALNRIKGFLMGKMRNSYSLFIALLGSELFGSGFQTQLDSDVVRFAVVRFGLTIEYAIHLVTGVSIGSGPLRESDALLLEATFNLFG